MQIPNVSDHAAPLPVYLREDELALRWHVSRRTLQRWRRQKRGPGFLVIGGAVRYRGTDILAYESRVQTQWGRPS